MVAVTVSGEETAGFCALITISLAKISRSGNTCTMGKASIAVVVLQPAFTTNALDFQLVPVAS